MPSKGVRILFIDDQADFLEAMAFWMKSKGHEVFTTTDPAVGLRLIRQGLVDVAFVDFKMPVMDGVEVITKIREFNQTIPVVLLTGHADEAIARNAKKLNIAGFFSKMGAFQELERVLDVVLRGLQRADAKPQGGE